MNTNGNLQFFGRILLVFSQKLTDAGFTVQAVSSHWGSELKDGLLTSVSTTLRSFVKLLSPLESSITYLFSGRWQ